MKNVFISPAILIVLCLSLSSCSKDDLIAPDSNASDELRAIEYSSSADTIETNSFPFITPYDLSRHNMKGTSSNSKVADWTQFGPYSVPGTLTKLQSNRKMSLINKPPYASGVYFCDIWKMEKQVTLPTGAIMMFQGASKVGYSNYTTLTSGVLVIQNGNVYTFVTYSVVPVYNSAGQYIYNGTLPMDLTGSIFTYSYLRDI